MVAAFVHTSVKLHYSLLLWNLSIPTKHIAFLQTPKLNLT